MKHIPKMKQIAFFSLVLVFSCAQTVFLAEAAKKDDPVAVELHYQNGIKYFNRGLYDRSITELQKTLELDSEHAEAKEFLAKVQKTKEEKKSVESKMSTDAQIKELYKEGRQRYQKKDYEAAIETFNKILSIKSIDDFASFYKERCEILLGRKLSKAKKIEDRDRLKEKKIQDRENLKRAKEQKKIDRKEMLKKRSEINEERRGAQEERNVKFKEDRAAQKERKIEERKIKIDEKKALKEQRIAEKKEKATAKKGNVKKTAKDEVKEEKKGEVIAKDEKVEETLKIETQEEKKEEAVAGALDEALNATMPSILKEESLEVKPVVKEAVLEEKHVEVLTPKQRKIALVRQKKEAQQQLKNERKAAAQERREEKIKKIQEVRDHKIMLHQQKLEDAKARKVSKEVAREEKIFNKGKSKEQLKEEKNKQKKLKTDAKELYLKGVDHYAKKNYQEAFDTLSSVVEFESTGKKLYTNSAKRLMNKAKKKLEASQKQ
jgi:outer membrane protein assembly factor BamD (BamD/ComL family)